MIPRERFPHYWICSTCAKERGGVWPENHIATVMEDTCPYCEGKKQPGKTIAPWVDYNWPKDKQADSKARLGRD